MELSAKQRYRRNTRFRLFCNANGQCEYCQRVTLLPFGTVDHRTPKSRGGLGGTNLAWACLRCNLRKGDMTEGEFRLMLSLPAHNAGINAASSQLRTALEHRKRRAPPLPQSAELRTVPPSSAAAGPAEPTGATSAAGS